MINFFRKIRKQLADDNKPLKYARYAIGEILLVVVGILIALQINNWNEQKKEEALEQEYYCRLLEDVDLDLEQINILIIESKVRLKASNQATRLLQKPVAYKIEIGEQIGKSILSIYSDFRPNDAAFEDLKSGANINIIKDKSIIKALNYYFNKVEGYISIIKVNGENAVKIFYAHSDVFENGWVQSSMSLTTGRFYRGMDKDLYQAVDLDKSETFSSQMQKRLYNESLQYISHNSRQLDLYQSIKDEIIILKSYLETKCANTND